MLKRSPFVHWPQKMMTVAKIEQKKVGKINTRKKKNVNKIASSMSTWMAAGSEIIPKKHGSIPEKPKSNTIKKINPIKNQPDQKYRHQNAQKFRSKKRGTIMRRAQKCLDRFLLQPENFCRSFFGQCFLIIKMESTINTGNFFLTNPMLLIIKMESTSTKIEHHDQIPLNTVKRYTQNAALPIRGAGGVSATCKPDKYKSNIIVDGSTPIGVLIFLPIFSDLVIQPGYVQFFALKIFRSRIDDQYAYPMIPDPLYVHHWSNG